MTPDKNKIAADCWRKGTEAMARENWDYAIDMFSKSVALVPDNLMYRQTLRGCERKKYKDNGSGARMASVKLMGVRTKIKKSRMQKDWEAVDRAAEEGLQVNPWDAQLNFDMGEACRNLEYMECALYGLQSAVECDRENKQYNRELAHLLESRGNYGDAIKCWERIRRIDNEDPEARKKIGELSTQSVIEGGGYEGAEGSKDVRKGGSAYDDYRPTKSQRQAVPDGPGVDPVKDLERTIRKEPENVNNYVKLAELHRDNKRYSEALAAYQQALQVSGGDPNLREQVEDLELEEMRRNLEIAKERARADADDEEARQNASAIATELVKREIETFSRRLERHPKDTKVKFELAQRFMRIRKIPQAIPLLQQAANDQRLEIDVLIALGECFLSEKKNELAIRQFKRAVPKIDSHDKPDLFKRCHYMLGRLYESGGKAELAEEHFNEVLAIDYEYRDVLARLEKLQSEDS